MKKDTNSSLFAIHSPKSKLQAPLNSEMAFRSYTAFSSALAKPHPTELCRSKLLSETAAPRLEDDVVTRLVHPSIPPLISSAQLDAIALAAKSHNDGFGFILADATGCGKGRTAMASALNHCLATECRLVIYVSVTNVFPDVSRDYEVFRDRFKRLKMSLKHVRDGVPSKGVVFVPYSFLRKSSQAQLLKKCAKCALVVDESHSATKLTGAAASVRAKVAHAMVVKAHSSPDSSVLFCSATWASSVADLQLYSEVLGLVGEGCPFDTWGSMDKLLGGTRASFGFLELVSSELTVLGRMVSRQLSMEGVGYHLADAPPSDAHLRMHDALSGVWQRVLALKAAQVSECRGVAMGAGIRLWKAMGLSGRVEAALRESKQALADGHQVVLSLVATGETAAKRGAGGGEEEVAEGAAGAVLSDTLLQLLTRIESGMLPDDPECVEVDAIRSEIARLSLYPASALDMLKQGLGGSECVAELTGRSTYVEEDALGVWRARPRPASDDVSAERARFQSGEKKVVLLSQACDTGTSLHAERADSARRVQLLFEPPWSSSRAMQQLGRTHRAGQHSAPLYVLLKTSGPELRFAATIASRLKSLGALCSGDRDVSSLFTSPEEVLPADELLGAHASVGMRNTLRQFVEGVSEQDKADHEVMKRTWCTAAEHPRQFLNRILTAPHAVGERVFEAFCDATEAERNRRTAQGGGLSEAVRTVNMESCKVREEPSYAVKVAGKRVVLRQFTEDRGLSFEEAKNVRDDLVEKGARPSDVYLSNACTLVHLRTRTTAREYMPHNNVPVNTSRDYVASRATDFSRLEEMWNECYAFNPERRMHTSYVATLPALQMVSELQTSRPVMARLVGSDGVTIAISVDSYLVEAHKARRLRRQAEQAQAAIAAQAAAAAAAAAAPMVAAEAAAAAAAEAIAAAAAEAAAEAAAAAAAEAAASAAAAAPEAPEAPEHEEHEEEDFDLSECITQARKRARFEHHDQLVCYDQPPNPQNSGSDPRRYDRV